MNFLTTLREFTNNHELNIILDRLQVDDNWLYVLEHNFPQSDIGNGKVKIYREYEGST